MSGTRAPGWPKGLTAKIAAAGARALRHALLRLRSRRARGGGPRRRCAFPAPFGLTLRYAMKANPSHGILALFRDLGLHVDASSDFEVERALRAGFPPERIQLTSQMPSRRLARAPARAACSSTPARSTSSRSSGASRRAARCRCG